MATNLRTLSRTLARLARLSRASEPVARVFVYGTLKRRERAARLLDGATFEGTATLRGFRLYAGRTFPAILRGAGTVRGECYRADRATLRALDRYEGAPTLYTRERVTVTTDRGARVDAFVYTMGRAPFPQWVPMGDTWSAGEGYRVRLCAARSLSARDALARDAFAVPMVPGALARYLEVVMPETAPERERVRAQHARADADRAAHARRVALSDARALFGYGLVDDPRPADLSDAWNRWERGDDARADAFARRETERGCVDPETCEGECGACVRASAYGTDPSDAYRDVGDDALQDDAPARVRADIERAARAERDALQD